MSSKLLIVILSTLVLIIALTHTVNGYGKGCGKGGPTDHENGSGGRGCTWWAECCSGQCQYTDHSRTKSKCTPYEPDEFDFMRF